MVFVGDTHGDIDATRRIFTRYPVPGHTLVFLGDTVDRGPDSGGNLELILQAKLDHPTSIYLLMGNHEAWKVRPFAPADFWERLDSQEERVIANALLNLPLQQHIGTGTAEQVTMMEVYWPASDSTQTFRNIAVNQTIVVTEGQSAIRRRLED